MRLDTPSASGYFVGPKNGSGPHTLIGARALWAILERATGVKTEFKNGNWVLDEPSELSEDFAQGNWALTANYHSTRDYVRIDVKEGLIRFYGSPTSASHQALGKLWEELRDAGYDRYEHYGDALRARNRSNTRLRRPKQHAVVDRKANQQDSVDRQRRQRRWQSLSTALAEAFKLFRNMMALLFAASVFIGHRAVQPAVVVAIASSVGVAMMIYVYDNASRGKEE
jgi:hypothetical protein